MLLNKIIASLINEQLVAKPYKMYYRNWWAVYFEGKMIFEGDFQTIKQFLQAIILQIGK